MSSDKSGIGCAAVVRSCVKRRCAAVWYAVALSDGVVCPLRQAAVRVSVRCPLRQAAVRVSAVHWVLPVRSELIRANRNQSESIGGNQS